jgi:peptidoglycan lytic transglycosylase
MRRLIAGAVCVLSLALLAQAHAAVPAPVRLAPETRDRFAAAMQSYRGGDWATAARELGEVARAAAPIAEYALLYQAESLSRLGDATGARAAAQQAADQAPDSRAAPAAVALAAEQSSRAGDEAGAALLWRRFLDRFPDHLDVTRARLAWAQALANAGRGAEAAAAYRELWLLIPAAPQGEQAGRELRALAVRGVPVAPPTPLQRLERAERLVAAGVAEPARAEAEALLASPLALDHSLRALRVAVEASRRLNRDDAALAGVNRALVLAPADKRSPWLLESAKIQQKKNRDGAVLLLDRLLAEQPKSAEAPEAMLLKARILEAGPVPRAAEPVYLKLAQTFPESDEGLAAIWRLGWLSWLRADYAEAVDRWNRIPTVRTASQAYRDASTYWIGRALTERGELDGAARQFAQLVSEAPRSYYGVLASRRAPRAQPSPGRNPASAQLAATLPADPRELLQSDAPWARIEALRAVGLGDHADEEMDETVRRSIGDPRRLYALAAAYGQESRFFLSLRILRRHFMGVARSAPPSLPRTFWDLFYPMGWRVELSDAASRAALDPSLVAAVVREESSFHSQARSRVGARGLMQLMPDTARQLAKSRGLPTNEEALDDPAVNLVLGSTYLAALVKEFGEPRLAVAAYNAGPTRVREWWKGRASDDLEVWVELIPFVETRGFVRRVMLSWEEYRRLYPPGAASATP